MIAATSPDSIPFPRWDGIDPARHPWPDLCRLMLAEDAARQREQEANPVEKEQATRDRVMFGERIAELRGIAVSAVLSALGWACESYPAVVASILEPIFRPALEEVEEAIVALESRVDELETATVALETGEAVPS